MHLPLSEIHNLMLIYMKQGFFILTAIVLLFACRTTQSVTKSRAALAGKYKMEMVMSEEYLKRNPQAVEVIKQAKLESELKANGVMYMNMEARGQTLKDTAKWDVHNDSLIIFFKSKREAALINKVEGGFTITQKGVGDPITIKYTKQK